MQQLIASKKHVSKSGLWRRRCGKCVGPEANDCTECESSDESNLPLHLYVKEGEGRDFLILDGAMNDLIRPAMYEAYHDIIPVVEPTPGLEPKPYDIVGPVCESGDTFAKQRQMPPLGAGDLVAFRSAGAYGAVMSSEYNSRPLIPEVLVHGREFAVIRARPTFDEMINRDTIPEWL